MLPGQEGKTRQINVNHGQYAPLIILAICVWYCLQGCYRLAYKYSTTSLHPSLLPAPAFPPHTPLPLSYHHLQGVTLQRRDSEAKQRINAKGNRCARWGMAVCRIVQSALIARRDEHQAGVFTLATLETDKQEEYTPYERPISAMWNDRKLGVFYPYQQNYRTQHSTLI